MGIISHDFYYARQVEVSCAKGSRIFSNQPILYLAGYYNEVKRIHGSPEGYLKTRQIASRLVGSDFGSGKIDRDAADIESS